ncbi:hypothetical protein CCUG60885_00414 [Mycobacteroides salmoniphilum]|uniref:Uncharacterized protein n=1 Tax=Mycobacteroides salmoniphilum TaxID=404941 RepID=A0A4R8SLW8_9MYCO|nr:hypothetical protein CCUG60885_00414 [Mycobacteroides salmoniphilum]TEA03074.1 hypothetical protein CCUG60883_03698 [Mycobacteroides salmoniphilum]
MISAYAVYVSLREIWNFRVKHTLATRLVNELIEAADEKLLAKTITRYGRATCCASMSLATWKLGHRGTVGLLAVSAVDPRLKGRANDPASK